MPLKDLRLLSETTTINADDLKINIIVHGEAPEKKLIPSSTRLVLPNFVFQQRHCLKCLLRWHDTQINFTPRYTKNGSELDKSGSHRCRCLARMAGEPR